MLEVLTIFRLIVLRLKKVLGTFFENGINLTENVYFKIETRVSKLRPQVFNKLAQNMPPGILVGKSLLYKEPYHNVFIQ